MDFIAMTYFCKRKIFRRKKMNDKLAKNTKQSAENRNTKIIGQMFF